MQVDIRKAVLYGIGLEMSAHELELLKGMMQNPVGLNEGSEERKIRETIWNACNEAQQS